MNIDIDKLILELKAIDSNMGLYPAALKGHSEEKDYEQRDGFKNGWNACVCEYGRKLNHAIEVSTESANNTDKLFLADGENTFYYGSESGWNVFLNDTWYYACGDLEEIPKEKENEVAKWYRDYGSIGVLYWVYLQRKHLPDIVSVKKRIEVVYNLEHETTLEEERIKSMGYIDYLLEHVVIIDKTKSVYDISRLVIDKYNQVYGCCPFSWHEFVELIKKKLN